MHFFFLTAAAAFLASLAIAAAPPPVNGRKVATPSHVYTAPYGGPDTYFEGYAEDHSEEHTGKHHRSYPETYTAMHPSPQTERNVNIHGPPGHVNTTPYGGPDTYFQSLEEAKNGSHIHARNQAGVYWCPGTDEFYNPCFYTIASGGACHSWHWVDLASTNRATASFGPDHGIRCSIWAGPNCGPGTQPASFGVVHGIEYPGFNQLSEVVPVYDWTPRSFNCRWI